MIVIDTHIFIWWVSTPEKLSQKARLQIEKASRDGTIFISSISVWEIYLLVNKGRLQLTIDTDRWLESVESIPFIQFVPIDNKIAAKSVTLPGIFNNDPADRMIVATAREKGIPLITSDKQIQDYSHVQTIW